MEFLGLLFLLCEYFSRFFGLLIGDRSPRAEFSSMYSLHDFVRLSLGFPLFWEKINFCMVLEFLLWRNPSVYLIFQLQRLGLFPDDSQAAGVPLPGSPILLH